LCTTAPPRSFAELSNGIESGKLTHVLALGSQIPNPAEVSCLETVAHLVALSAHSGPLARHANVLLPVCTWAETTSTFVNAQGLAQQSDKAISPAGDSVPGWKLIAALARELGFAMNWSKLADVRRAMAPEPGALATEPGVVHAGAAS
jgi:predicted molibdopterin-dependent oxidoreductase YjgC